jgi:hypothetical protein
MTTRVISGDSLNIYRQRGFNMNKYTSFTTRLCCTALVAATLVVAGSGPVLADPPDRNYRGDQNAYQGDRRGRGDQKGRPDKRYRDQSRDQSRDQYRDQNREQYRDQNRDYRKGPPVVYRGKSYVAPRGRMRRYRDVVIVRPYGHWYTGYAHYYHDDDAYKWLAFTAITLGVLNLLNEQQQREHEAAQIAATTAPLGERIVWHDGAASGTVIATREGTGTSGRYCREFQQEVSVGGRMEQAYGTACRNPDGSWEVISAGGQ